MYKNHTKILDTINKKFIRIVAQSLLYR